MPTVQDARHHVAVVALHNFLGTTSLHQVLPPLFRDLWHELTACKFSLLSGLIFV
jgi:hypothetical protein